MFKTTKFTGQTAGYIFTACFISGTKNRQKFGGSGGYTLEKFFLADLHELEKQPKTKVGGQLAPLASPPPPGGATGHHNIMKVFYALNLKVFPNNLLLIKYCRRVFGRTNFKLIQIQEKL